MEIEISQTKKWLSEIIVGFNFCPFAKKEMVNNTIHYYLSSHKKIKLALAEIVAQCQYLTEHSEVETSLIIYQQGFADFNAYLDLVAYADELLITSGFEGQYQLASFHPDYCFEGEAFDDAANFTNRSPYPTIHIIREASMARVLQHYPQPEEIPENNIKLAREQGGIFFKDYLTQLKR